MARVVTGPDLPVRGVPLELGIRRILVHRFPYAIVFMRGPHEIHVLAFAHFQRRSGYWMERL
jgi:hypothetical protein